MFRIDFSMKTEEPIDMITLKFLVAKGQKRGLLRYKHKHIYHYEQYVIKSSTVYETEKEP